MGFLAETEVGYASCFAAVLDNSDTVNSDMRKRAREASAKFSDAIFIDAIIKEIGELLFPSKFAKSKAA